MALRKPLVMNTDGSVQELPASDSVVPFTIPTGGLAGQVLAKSSTANYDSAWVTKTEITVGTTAPASPNVGDLWVDTN